MNLRFLRFNLVAASWLSMLAAGCDSPKAPLARPTPVHMDGDRGASVPGAPLSASDLQLLDQAVIEAALVDLLESTDEDSEMLRREQGHGRLLFSSKSREVVGTIRQAMGDAESEKWKLLSSSDRIAAKSAVDIVVGRIENKQFVTEFQPLDARISLWEDDPASTQPGEPTSLRRPEPISAAPPGYADQNRLAVVVFGFAWSRHSGDAVYVLRFDRNRWRVISKNFLYYL